MGSELKEIQLACFTLGENLLAVDIMRIREIIQPQKMSPLLKPSPILEGMINLRGNVMPVMNLKKRFAMAENAFPNTGKLLLVSIARQTVALMVDSVMEVITVPVEDIHPPLDSSTGIGIEFLIGLTLHQEKLYMILDIDSLLTGRDFK